MKKLQILGTGCPKCRKLAEHAEQAMKELGLTGLPVTHIENASATGLVAFREAAWAVASGRAEVAMASQRPHPLRSSVP